MRPISSLHLPGGDDDVDRDTGMGRGYVGENGQPVVMLTFEEAGVPAAAGDTP